MEEKIEDIETSDNNEEVVEDVLDTDEVEETDEATGPTLEDYEELKRKNKELFERAKKAEAQAKTLKVKKETKSALTEEDLIRTARVASQIDDEDLELLKTIQGDSLAEKLENPLFKSYKEAKEKKLKAQKAQLPSSGGASVYSPPKMENMSEDEHRAMWEKMRS